MVWKQDLAKLKAQLREEPAPPPPRKVVAAPPVAPPQSMEEEDALFLAMMGRRAPRPAPPGARLPEAPEGAAPPVEAPAAPQDFASALAGLKGMRPLQMDPVLSAGTGGGPALQREPAPMAPPPPAPSPEEAPGPPQAQASVEPPAVAVPVRIQLAAGMAVEVDGALDLRGHSLQDALERLKDRVADIQYLHWRSLLVQLGPEPGHQEGLQALLAQGGLPGVARFAQAPIPMGGPQAWILYLNA